MFTGLIEEVGIVRNIKKLPDGQYFQIQTEQICQELHIDDSVAVNGICLTVTEIESNIFSATAVSETLDRTTAGHLKQGDAVNLERALPVSGRMGGHWVQGHVDGIGTIHKIEKKGTGWQMIVNVPGPLLKYCVEKGSITLDGISLTIAVISGEQLTVAVIPHTIKNTTLGQMEKNRKINIEVDILAKYVERLLNHERNLNTHDESWYRSHGF